MNEHLSITERVARQQIAERVAEASTRRLASRLPGVPRRHLGLRRRGDRLES